MWFPGATSKLRKINEGYYPAFFQLNWLAQVRDAEPSSQVPIYAQPTAPVVIPTQQTDMSFKFMQPATVPAAPTQPSATMSDQTQKFPEYCAICTPTRKQCPKQYPMPLKSNWSDLEEEENDTNKKKEEEIEDWDGNLQKKRTKRTRT